MVNVNKTLLIEGDATSPRDSDLLLQQGTLKVGLPVPEGWRVLTGNQHFSEVWLIAYRYEIQPDFENPDDGEPRSVTMDELGEDASYYANER